MSFVPSLLPLGIRNNSTPAVITMPESDTPVSPISSVNGRRSIHENMTAPNRMPTRFSAGVIGPICSRSSCRCWLTSSLAGTFTGCMNLVNTHQAIGNITNVTGMPTVIQRAKLISRP